jgi:hypothetical protein
MFKKQEFCPPIFFLSVLRNVRDANLAALYLHCRNSLEAHGCMFEFKGGETAWLLGFPSRWLKTPM